MRILKSIKPFLKLIVPLITISLGGMFALTGNTILPFPSEQIISSLLALLAVEALIERIFVLDKIEKKLGSQNQLLKTREYILPFGEMVAKASEISVLAISGSEITNKHISLLEQHLKQKRRIRILLVDPSSEAFKLLKKIDQTAELQLEIEASIGRLRNLRERLNTKEVSLLQVKLLSIVPPFTMVGINLNDPRGVMTVEHLGYNIPSNNRHHMLLKKSEDYDWFEYYRKQFDDIWENPNASTDMDLSQNREGVQ